MRTNGIQEPPNWHWLKRSIGSWAIVLTVLGLAMSPVPANGDTPVILYESLAGNINITGTGGTLRTAADPNSCPVVNNGTMQLSGIPAGATVRKAYLYWAGSGGDPAGGVGPDYNVTFNGTAVTADRTYTAWYLNGYNLYFFGGVKDVTTLVAGNGVYTFADLTVQNANVAGGGQYCTNAAVLSAFSLLIVYDDPTEILHVVNIWEGFQAYRGASITLTPTNFTVPTPAPVTALSSRIMILTWEGDSGNSGAFGGFNENLTFCSPTPCAGAALTDAYNPVNNQFNSTVDMPPSGPFSGIDTTWGLDLDLYDITNRIPAGAASAQSVYSSGGDLVFLANQTMAIPNVPVADLAITKSHSGTFASSTNGVYTVTVTNNGPSNATGTITVSDTLPAGLTYVSASGPGWTCGAVGQVVTCTRTGPLANGVTAPSITLTVSVGPAAYPAVTNTATVSNPTFDNVAGNNIANDLTVVNVPELSTSTKTWVDSNGADQDPNDSIRYTLTLTNSAGIAATGVSATDNIPANMSGFTVVSIPAGATNGSTGAGTGANGTGYLNISNITVPAGSSITIAFDVTIAGGTPAGTLINNTAAITNPWGPGAAPAASSIIVSGSSLPQAGDKQLYLHDAASAPANKLSRTPMAVNAASFVAIPRGNTTRAWTLSPALRSSVTITTNVRVDLWLSTNSTRNYAIPVTLLCGAATVATQTRTIALTNGAPPALFVFNLPRATPYACPAGNTWVLTITNTQGAGGALRDIRVYPAPAVNNYSNAALPSQNVINVDSVVLYDAAYNGGNVLASVLTGTTVYVRSVVSDPFGSYDITGATVLITDSLGTVRVTAAMTLVNDSGLATKTYEYAYAVPAGGPAGNWTVRVDAAEGAEGTISDYANIGMLVILPMPSLMVVKSATVISDPVSGVTPTAKAIPGAVMEYTVTVINSGIGVADADSIVITDPVPANSTMFIDTAGTAVTFTCGGCGLANPWTYANTVSYSYQPGGGAPYVYPPTTIGYDPLVTGVRIKPEGVLNGGGASFSVKFRVQIN